MNPHQNITEQDLFALHLNELPETQARAVRRAIAQDVDLAAESADIAATLAAVSAPNTPMPLTQSTLDRNWLALRSSLAVQTPEPVRWRLPALAAGLLTATAAGVALFLVHHRPTPAEPAPTQAETAAHPTEAPSPLLTATPRAPADAHLREPGFRANYTSGVFHPQPHSAPIHLIGLAPQPATSPSSPAREPATQPLTLLPTPRLTVEPQMSPIAAAQPQSQSPSIHAAGLRSRHPVDLLLAAGGTFIAPHSSLTGGTEPRTLTATHAIVALAAVHQQFHPFLGYRITVSYTRPEIDYTYAASTTPGTGGFYDSGAVNSRIYALAGTYVVKGPHRKRLSTSADAGGALLAFLPTVADPSTSYVYRGAGVLGASLDYAFTEHVGARLTYRAQLFKAPDFRYNGGTIPITTPLIVNSEPSLGITYTFGKR